MKNYIFVFCCFVLFIHNKAIAQIVDVCPDPGIDTISQLQATNCVLNKLKYVDITTANGTLVLQIKGASLRVSSPNQTTGLGNLAVGHGHNTSLSTNSIIVGSSHTSTSRFVSIIGGSFHRAEAYASSLYGGIQNQINATSDYSSIFGGMTNKIEQNKYSSINGGLQNTVTRTSVQETYSSKNVINGGKYNKIDQALASVINGGENNVIQASIPSRASVELCPEILSTNMPVSSNVVYSVINGGKDNIIGEKARIATLNGGMGNVVGYSEHSVVNGGLGNVIRASTVQERPINTFVKNAVINGGSCNVINVSTNSVINGGLGNIISPYLPPLPQGFNRDGVQTVVPTELNFLNNVIVGGLGNSFGEPHGRNLAFLYQGLSISAENSGIIGGRFNVIMLDTRPGIPKQGNVVIIGGRDNTIERAQFSAIFGGNDIFILKQDSGLYCCPEQWLPGSLLYNAFSCGPKKLFVDSSDQTSCR